MSPALAKALMQSINADIDSPAQQYDEKFRASMVALAWITACSLFKRNGIMAEELVDKLSESAAECLADLELAKRQLNDEHQKSH